MSEGNTHETYDFGNDPEFQKNFYKNIDRVLSDVDIDKDVDIVNEVPEEDKAFIGMESTKEKDELIDDPIREDLTVADEIVTDVTTGDDTARDITEVGIDKIDSSKEEDDIVADEITIDEDSSDETATDELSLNDISLNKDEEVEEFTEAGEETASALEQVDDIEAIDETLYDINASLASQISDELENINANKQKNKKVSRAMKIQLGVIIGIVSLLVFAFFLGFTKPGNQLLIKMGINISGIIWDVWTDDFVEEPNVVDDVDHLEEDDLSSDAEEIDPDKIVWPDHPGYGRQEEGSYNILLLGEEAIGSGTSRGRTDLIIIATLNKNQNAIKLTSLMRDTLVQIPGYKENKLNSAYEKGGVDLLYETIALNFNIRLDGCVLVNFENFEEIIDYMGGIEITLTSSEARYLNNTNYISNPKYRNVVAGTQLMNGNQVLGYSRIRKRAAITGNNNDYGRTDRHRLILNAIFEKYKSKSEIELGAMLYKMLPMVKTDIERAAFEKLLDTFIEMRTTKIDQLRIPADGTFTDNVKVRGMDVLIPDLEKNVDILHEFVFGS